MVSKRYICFADDLNINFDYTYAQVSKFDEMWKQGYSTNDISRALRRKIVEIDLLAADRFLRKKIKPRKGGMSGTRVIERKDKIVIE